jgi:multiple sugar transport system ATP-binding protein
LPGGEGVAGIKLKNIWKRFTDDIVAVNDFSLEIPNGEFVVLVGPSGCGKSTTLRMIAGLEEISDGELYIGDKLVNNLPPKDRDIAMVFQNYALYPHMTVFRNMAFGLELRRTPQSEIRERVMEAACVLGIEQLLDRKPKALSGGQRQRVALGRAMVRNPSVFLLDEPLSNLDAKLRASMRTELIKLHRKLGTTFVYVTHDQTEAMTMGDRIVVMKDGVIQQVDTPQNLYNSPCNTFVAGFIGNPQMNFLDGTLLVDDGNCYVAIGNDRFYLDRKITPALNEYRGRKVSMGVRPEDINDDADFVSARPNSTFKAIVEVSELMGNEVYLYLNYMGIMLTSRVASHKYSLMGLEMTFAFDTRHAHIFDSVTGERIAQFDDPR